MRLYNGVSPNGARVEIFMAEKDIVIPVVPINVPAGETRESDFLKRNSLAEIPVLELDDGSHLTESVAICRYLETLHPTPPLFGEDALSQARIEMWNRRMELKVFNAIGDFARHEFEFFKSRGQVPEFAVFRRREFAEILSWLDRELSDGRPFIAGQAFSIADITGMATLILMKFAEYVVPEKLGFVTAWTERMYSRSSFPKWPS